MLLYYFLQISAFIKKIKYKDVQLVNTIFTNKNGSSDRQFIIQ